MLAAKWSLNLIPCCSRKEGSHVNAEKQDCIEETLHSLPSFLLLVKHPRELRFLLDMVGWGNNHNLYVWLDRSHMEVFYSVIRHVTHCAKLQHIHNFEIFHIIIVTSLLTRLFSRFLFPPNILYFWFFSLRSANMNLSKSFVVFQSL